MLLILGHTLDFPPSCAAPRPDPRLLQQQIRSLPLGAGQAHALAEVCAGDSVWGPG